MTYNAKTRTQLLLILFFMPFEEKKQYVKMFLEQFKITSYKSSPINQIYAQPLFSEMLSTLQIQNCLCQMCISQYKITMSAWSGSELCRRKLQIRSTETCILYYNLYA